MAIVATALRGTGRRLVGGLMIGVLAVMTVGAMVLIPSARARGWVKVKLAKHLFEHRYDYRTEWLRFTETLGRAGPDAPPLGERIVKAFADIVDAPGGLLLVNDGGRGLCRRRQLNWPAANLPADGRLRGRRRFLERGRSSGRIARIRRRFAKAGPAADATRRSPSRPGCSTNPRAWAAIPLLHHAAAGRHSSSSPRPNIAARSTGRISTCCAPRADQAASSLAEALGQEALANAQRFEEFNRRFAFILHDIKNLVSQLSLLARNAERHADNPEFRTDMVATLKSSVGKMNDLLARLSPRVVVARAAASRRSRCGRSSPRPSPPSAATARSSCLATQALVALVDADALEQAVGHLLQNARRRQQRRAGDAFASTATMTVT